jgi:4-amino-4-deoxy-L-arabinose transferase-like glycosyltransferase
VKVVVRVRRTESINVRVAIAATLFVICAVAFVVRLFPMQVSHWWDETVYLQNAEVIFSGRTNYDEFILRPPVLSILIAAAFAIHHSAFAAGVLTAALGAAVAGFVFLIGRELYGPVTGILAALFLAVTPFFTTASHWIMTDVPSLTFLAIAFYLLLLGGRKNAEHWFALAGFFFGVAVLTRFTSAVVTAVVPAVYFLVVRPRWKHLLWLAGGAAIVVVPYLAWAQWRFGSFLVPFIRANNAVSDRVGDATFYFRHLLEIYPLFIVVGFALYLIELLAVARPVVQRDGANVHVGVTVNVQHVFAQTATSIDAVLALWIVIFFVYISLTPHKEPRYIAPMAIPFVLLAAKGYAGVFAATRTVRYVVAALLVAMMVPSAREVGSRLRGPYVNYAVSDAVEASRYLTSLKQPKAPIYTNHDYPVYAYYTGMPIVVIPGDQSFYSDYARQMTRKGFLIIYPDTGKQPTQQWLDSQPRFRRLRVGSETVLYEFNP